MLVLPGFVETHWHIWTDAAAQPRRRPPRARLLSRRRAPSARSIPPRTCTPRAGWPPPRRSIRASRSCTTGATTSAAPTTRKPRCARSRKAGIRARFSYGSPTGASNDASIDLRDLDAAVGELARAFERRLADARARVARRGVGGDLARLRGREGAPACRSPCTRTTFSAAPAASQQLAERGLLAPGHAGHSRRLVHAARRFARSPTTASTSACRRTRRCASASAMPIVGDLIAAGVTSACPSTRRRSRGNADMFAIMKAIQNIENGRALERVQAHGAPRARARDDRRRALDGHRRQRRLADAGQARRPHHGRHARGESRRVDRARAPARRGGAARQRRYGHDRRPHPQTRRAPDDA